MPACDFAVPSQLSSYVCVIEERILRTRRPRKTQEGRDFEPQLKSQQISGFCHNDIVLDGRVRKRESRE